MIDPSVASIESDRQSFEQPGAGVWRVFDGMTDAIVGVDPAGDIAYANHSVEALLHWAPGTLDGQPFSNHLVGTDGDVTGQFLKKLAMEPGSLAGQRLYLDAVTHDGVVVQTDAMVSVFTDGPDGQPMVVVALRARDGRRLRRWSVLSQQLLDALSEPSEDPPAERLLSILCRQLGWDVGTLWGLEPDGTLVCRSAWTPPAAPARALVAERRRDPKAGSGGLPRQVFDHGVPEWMTDFSEDEGLLSPAAVADGLRSVCAFPVRYRGQVLGVVKLMSRRRRPRDSEMIDLMGAVSGQLGELLHAMEEADQRDRLVQELEATTNRHEFLLRASRVLSEAAGYAETLDRLAEVAVPALGDLCMIDVVDEEVRLSRLVARHAVPARQPLADELRTRFPPDPEGHHPAAEVRRDGKSRWSSDMTDDFLRETTQGDQHLALVHQLQFTSYMTVPLSVGGEVRGTVTLVSAGSGRRFSSKDLAAAEELADQMAAVVERARIHDREHRISHTLQESLLPDRLPEVPGLVLAGRYLPAADYAEVGGDWYDALLLDGGNAGLVVGDVQGHDMEAASIMGRLRHALSLMLSEGAAPAEALGRLNQFLLASEVDHIATVLVAILDPRTGHLRYASAGHPPPVLVCPTGPCSLPVATGPPLGLPGAAYSEHIALMGEGPLLLFTDGLIERRDRDLDEATVALLASVSRAPHTDPAGLADYLLSEAGGDNANADDVVILSARRLWPGPGGRAVPAWERC